jgi:hypothetical protein
MDLINHRANKAIMVESRALKELESNKVLDLVVKVLDSSSLSPTT